MSWPPTLADDGAVAKEHLTDPEKPVSPTAEVFAPCCGRRCAADMVTDLRGLTGTTVRPGGKRPPEDIQWACDACYRRVSASRRNGWKRSSLARALGAPDAELRQIRAQEMVREKRAVGDSVNPAGFMQRKIADWEVQPSPIPGTDPPR